MIVVVADAVSSVLWVHWTACPQHHAPGHGMVTPILGVWQPTTMEFGIKFSLSRAVGVSSII